MPLTNGQSLSFYEILGPLGAGGMGEVYLAKDTRLDREVAIKVLPEHFADDRERLQRFEREAKTLASLNHQNVAGIHGIDQVDGTCFLAMELVPGEDLEDRLKRGAMPVDEAIEVCCQIAEGLEVAHEAGVVHRDLKPANVRITPDGVVKLLDFGLAKPMHPKLSESGTTGGTSSAQSDSFLVTEEGMMLGTPTYMSPEQARGKQVDKRTDIWAFGCVLYECLTGKRAFKGDVFGDLIVSILEREADLSKLPAQTPTHVRQLLERTLNKDPRARLRDIGEARLALAGSGPESSDTQTTSSWLPWGLVLASSAAALFFALRPGDAPETPPITELEQAAPTSAVRTFERKTFGEQAIYSAHFLPDGQSIVYSAAQTGNRPQTFLLVAGVMVPKELAPVGSVVLDVSSSGEIAILTDTSHKYHRVHEGTLARMTIDGSPRALIEAVSDATWGPDGQLAIVRSEAGQSRLEYPPGELLYETTGYISSPRVSADGTQVAFLDHPRSGDNRGWVKLVEPDGEPKTLTREHVAIEDLAWAPDGERLFFSGVPDAVQLQPCSVGREGGDERLEFGGLGEIILLDVADDGRMLLLREELFMGVALRPPGTDADLDLSWLDRSFGISFAADGQSAVFTNARAGANYSIVTRRFDGSPITTLGEGASYSHSPSPDGRWAFGILHNPSGLLLHPMGAGALRTLERGPIEKYHDAMWFPDSQSLLIIGNEVSQQTRCYRQSIDGGAPVPVTPAGVVGALSPLGDLILTKVEGTWMLYPLDGASPRVAKGLTEADIPLWSVDGKSVHAHKIAEVPLRLERVDLQTGERSPSFVIGPENEVGLFEVKLAEPVPEPGGGYCYSYKRRLSQLFVVGFSN